MPDFVEGLAHVAVVGTERFFPDRQRAFEELLSLAVLPLI